MGRRKTAPAGTYRDASVKPQDTSSKAGRDLESVLAVRDDSLEQYGKSGNTRKAYKGHLARGRQWLADIVNEARGRGLQDFEGMSLDLLEKAFDEPAPNEYSATALQLFLVQKCFTENLSKSTGEGIHAAFIQLWDGMDDQNFSGDYKYHKDTNTIEGNPARSPMVQTALQAIKTKAASKGAAATRQHAQPMTIEDLQILIRWSESVCSNTALTEIPATFEAMRKADEHGFIRTFAMTAFNLMTRNFETASLQFGDLEFGFHGPAPYYRPFFKIRLEERKGWQKQAGYDGPRTSNVYHMYEQTIPEIDIYSCLPMWLAHLEQRIGRPLQADDYIFPHISANGTIDMKTPVSYDLVQGYITQFTVQAGLKKLYTTHCFRRGGAQYRFMFAPLGERWSLARIRWWGGWAVGEHVDTLIKYLVDSLQSYETGHCDALCPTQVDSTKFFMGDDQALHPVTKHEAHTLKISTDEKIERTNETVSTILSFLKSIYGPNNISPLTSIHSSGSFTLPLHAGLPTQFNAAVPQSHYNPELELEHVREIPRASVTPPSYSSESSPSAPSSSFYRLDTYSQPTSTPSPQPQKIRKRASIPIPGVSIPAINRGQNAWKVAIQQWEVGGRGLQIPLKDWPSEWYNGDMKKITGSTRSSRKLIFEEYVRLGRNDEAFLHEYPAALKSISALLDAIREKRDRRRSSNRQ